jgi:hypothetical protein
LYSKPLQNHSFLIVFFFIQNFYGIKIGFVVVFSKMIAKSSFVFYLV